MTLDEANEVLRERFAPWIQDLRLAIEAIHDGRVRMRLPNSPHIARTGGMICGQALMATADTAMVFAVASRFGGFREMATVTQNTSFLRAARAGDLIAEIRILKAGRTLVFGEATMTVEGEDEPAAHATMTYAIAPAKA
ncbi:PaaI family thioesterase [Oceanibacterium hippocampi]|uniref:Thioesterase superfamily protein n=1 Tax=Oceanibacterium hippocampi TaxID=745714 RepID=A0A1Y5RUL9_9PROT|nr:PaaI family thioesterase [Oceanibacterium hippocampi]SLN25882.1 Thioesterase superfamily protein [Oceanibacterium hippocampi]